MAQSMSVLSSQAKNHEISLNESKKLFNCVGNKCSRIFYVMIVKIFIKE